MKMTVIKDDLKNEEDTENEDYLKKEDEDESFCAGKVTLHKHITYRGGKFHFALYFAKLCRIVDLASQVNTVEYSSKLEHKLGTA